VERIFSVEEANSLIPELTELLERLQRVHRSTAAVEGRALRRLASSNGSADAASAASAAGEEYLTALSAIESMGVVVRDPESGLVDFASSRDGNPIYLCWRLGEDRVGFWHPRDTGFAGREPL